MIDEAVLCRVELAVVVEAIQGEAADRVVDGVEVPHLVEHRLAGHADNAAGDHPADLTFGVGADLRVRSDADLVFFNAGPGTSANNPGHVGMVVSKGKMVEARCRLCGPIKVTSYESRDKIVGFTRPLQNPAVLDQLEKLKNASL